MRAAGLRRRRPRAAPSPTDLGTTMLVEAAAGTGKTDEPRRAHGRSRRDRHRPRRAPLRRHVHDQGRGAAVAEIPDPRSRAGAQRETRVPRERPRLDAGARPASTPPSSAPSTPSARGCCASGPSRPASIPDSRDGRARGRRRARGGLGPLHASASSPRTVRSSRGCPRSASSSRSCARPTRPSSRTRTSSRRSSRRPPPPDSRAGAPGPSRTFSHAPTLELPAERRRPDGWTRLPAGRAPRAAPRPRCVDRRVARQLRRGRSTSPRARGGRRERRRAACAPQFETLRERRPGPR